MKESRQRGPPEHDRENQPLDAEQSSDHTTEAERIDKSVVITRGQPPPETPPAEGKSTVRESQVNSQTSAHGNHWPRRLVFGVLLVLAVVAGILWLRPRILLALNTISTDDAYVAGHVTYIAPRIPGTILQVLVDDNQFVTKGQLIVRGLDPEPYQIATDRAAAAVAVAEGQIQQAETRSRAIVAGIPRASNNLKLTMDHIIEGISKLKASLATRDKTMAQRAVLAEAELRPGEKPLQSNSGTQQVVDQREAAYQVAVATEIEAHEQVHLAAQLSVFPQCHLPVSS